MSLKVKSKWGKLLHKTDPSDKTFKLNEDVVDFLKPSTEKERIPGEGTRQLAGPRLDVDVAQRWPDAADVKRAVFAQTYFNGKPKKNKNVSVTFVRTPPEIIGEGGDESVVPVKEISRSKVKLARSMTERRRVTPVLDMKAAEAHRHARNVPLSAPDEKTPLAQFEFDKFDNPRQMQSLGSSNHPSKHRFFDQPPAPPPHAQLNQDVPRPGIKRTPTTFSSLDDQEYHSSPASETSSPVGYVQSAKPPHIDIDIPTFDAPSPPFSPPISENPELASFLHESPPTPRSFPAMVQARQNVLRAEEGRVLRRLSRLEFDDTLDPRRPPSPNSPPRQSRSRSPQFVEPQPMIIPTSPPQSEGSDGHRSPSPDQAPPPIVLPHTRPHPLPQLPGQNNESSAPFVPPIRTKDIQVSQSSSFYENDSTLSPIEHRQRNHRAPSDAVSAISAASSNSTPSSTLHPNNPSRPQQPSGSHHPLPPVPSRGPSPSYFSQQTLAPQVPMQSNGLTPQPVDPYGRSGSVSSQSQYRAVSPSDFGADSAEYTACFEFGTRVAHMRAVLRLSAERERPIQTVTPRQWLRSAIWWLHKGRAGLTAHIKNAPKGPNGQRAEVLTQAHVDIAKTWWILTDVLSSPDSPQSKVDSPQDTLRRDIDIARANLRSFTLSMSRNNVMPPHQSMIQGQDTTMWVEYPRFASDVASLLRGDASKALVIEDHVEEANPLEALPLGDTKDSFCYSRMFVNASVNTEEVDTDRVVLPCILTMMRRRSEFETTIIISSQTDLVNMTIKPSDGGHGKGPSWHDVTWKARLHGIYIRLPRGFSLNIEFQESDFRALWSLVDYTNKTKGSMKPEADERLIHKAQLVELQHSDSASPHAFPRDRVRSCTALVFEKRLEYHSGLGDTKLHRGYRLLLLTNPVNKSLSMASLVLCRGSPLLFETSSASEPPTMKIHSHDPKRQYLSTLVFKSSHERQDLYDVLQGVTTGPEEHVTARVALRNLVMETTLGQETIAGAFQGLKWKEMRVITEANADAGEDQGDMTLSEHFRLIAMHDGGAVTDRLNLGPGELLMRLSASMAPTVTLLRAPQEDMTVSMDTRKTKLSGPDALNSLVQTAAKTPTTRTLTFPTMEELHVFQKAVTRYTVRYDGPATLFAISRRRMVVPIYKKWEATKVRIQVLTLGSVTKITAFFEDFIHADAMVFQIKSTDTFEKAKGDKLAKYCVKFVDAKFSLPKKEKDGEGDEDESPSDGRVWGRGVRRRFINMEGLEYAGEHDDITIGFETEEDRDQFSEALPAATINKTFQLRRKI